MGRARTRPATASWADAQLPRARYGANRTPLCQPCVRHPGDRGWLGACEELARSRSTKCCLCRRWLGCRDAEVREEGLQVDAEGFVVAVNRGPGDRFASQTRAPDAGDDRCDDLIPEGQQCGDG